VGVLLPPVLLRPPEELAQVDALLDDPVFFTPFAPHFHPLIGRPSTPIECYLRLMFLKFRRCADPGGRPADGPARGPRRR
jgi:transposase, IS5 family